MRAIQAGPTTNSDDRGSSFPAGGAKAGNGAPERRVLGVSLCSSAGNRWRFSKRSVGVLVLLCGHGLGFCSFALAWMFSTFPTCPAPESFSLPE